MVAGRFPGIDELGLRYRLGQELWRHEPIVDDDIGLLKQP
jgi:hypothetical protein